MNRLTKYRADIQAYDYIELRGGISQAVTNKLGKLEDLLQSYNVKDLEELDKLLEMATTYEELSKQLGCPLKVFFKWLKADYVYAYSEERKEFERFTNYALDEMFNKKEMIFQLVDYEYDDDFGGGAVFMELKLSDYKKTWWLKEDKSE